MYKKNLIMLIVLVLIMSACSNSINTTVNIYDKETEVETTPIETIVSEEGYTSMYASELAQFRLPEAGDTVVTLVTNYGSIDILMFPEVAPLAVENFVTHGLNDYYDGITFHRVIEDFMIQGGDPEGSGRGGESIWGSPFEDEFSKDYFPVRGSLAMANAGPGTNGSQFFIVQLDQSSEDWAKEMVSNDFNQEMIDAYMSLGGTPHLFNLHTVFGQVVRGLDVVDAIAAVDVGPGDMPVEPVVIEDVQITEIQ